MCVALSTHEGVTSSAVSGHRPCPLALHAPYAASPACCVEESKERAKGMAVRGRRGGKRASRCDAVPIPGMMPQRTRCIAGEQGTCSEADEQDSLSSTDCVDTRQNVHTRRTSTPRAGCVALRHGV
jgi:hypothetical protein